MARGDGRGEGGLVSKLSCNLRKSPGSVGSGKPSWGGNAPHLAEKGGALGCGDGGHAGLRYRLPPTPPALARLGSGSPSAPIFSERVHFQIWRATNHLGRDFGSLSPFPPATWGQELCLFLSPLPPPPLKLHGGREGRQPPPNSRPVSGHSQLCPQALETEPSA